MDDSIWTGSGDDDQFEEETSAIWSDHNVHVVLVGGVNADWVSVSVQDVVVVD